MMTSSDRKKSGAGEIMLFGVRLVVDSMRKCVSLNNLSEYGHPLDPSNSNIIDVAGGYASADDVAVARSSGGIRERKRGVPWTEDEHKLFLVGLEKVGKGDWRGISRNFVKTRTPTQVASHAQKYFLRRGNLNRRRRRSSLFDITSDSVCASPITDRKIAINGGSSQSPQPPQPQVQPATIEAKSLVINNLFFDTEMNLVRPLPILPMSESTVGFGLMNQNSMISQSPLSLTLSLSMSSDHQVKSSSSSSRMISVS